MAYSINKSLQGKYILEKSLKLYHEIQPRMVRAECNFLIRIIAS